MKDISEALEYKIYPGDDGYINIKILGRKTQVIYKELDLPVKFTISLGNSLIRTGKVMLREGELKR